MDWTDRDSKSAKGSGRTLEPLVTGTTDACTYNLEDHVCSCAFKIMYRFSNACHGIFNLRTFLHKKLKKVLNVVC